MYVFNNMVGSTGTGYSLKGKRLEFGMGGKWYKADSLGYEGAVEYAVSKILKHSNIKDYVSYQLEIINYNGDTFNGCVSIDFLQLGQQLVTTENLYEMKYKKFVEERLEALPLQNRIEKFVDDVKSITRLNDFGKYLTFLLELNTYTLNVDRNFFDILLIRKEDGCYLYCPIYNNETAYLSDTQNKYPLEKNINTLIAEVRETSRFQNLNIAVDCCQKLYGTQVKVGQYEMSEEILEIKELYGNKIYSRICEIDEHQKIIHPEFCWDDVRTECF